MYTQQISSSDFCLQGDALIASIHESRQASHLEFLRKQRFKISSLDKYFSSQRLLTHNFDNKLLYNQVYKRLDLVETRPLESTQNFYT